MLPEITDALVMRAIQTPRMVEAGRDYWTRGCVRQLSVQLQGSQVLAVVEGSGKQPYDVVLHFGKAAASRLSAECSCPVGLGCKHAAAALFALRAKMARPPPSETAAPPLSSPPAALPPALSQWLGAMRPLMREADVSAKLTARAAYYVLRAQALTGGARMGKKRSAASLEEPDGPLRLFVDVQDVTLDGEGRPTGARKIQHYNAYPAGAGAGTVYLSVEDQLIVRRLNARLGETDDEGCLAEIIGNLPLGPAARADQPDGFPLELLRESLRHGGSPSSSGALHFSEASPLSPSHRRVEPARSTGGMRRWRLGAP